MVPVSVTGWTWYSYFVTRKGSERPIDPLWRNGDWYADAWFLKQYDGIEAARGRGYYTYERLRASP